MYLRFFWIAILAVLASSCGKPKPTALEEREAARKAAKSSVVSGASFAATQYVRAVRECRIVGIPELQACAANKGMLQAETIAQLYAELSIDETADYMSQCGQKFSVKYCRELFTRAARMEWRRPVCGLLNEAPANLEEEM